jgi:hypothetical protein
MVAGASVLILVGAVFGANALATTSASQPAVTSETPAVPPAAGTPEPAETTEPAEITGSTEAEDPAEIAEPAENAEPTEAPDPAATNGADAGSQDLAPGDSDGSDGAPGSD